MHLIIKCYPSLDHPHLQSCQVFVVLEAAVPDVGAVGELGVQAPHVHHHVYV